MRFFIMCYCTFRVHLGCTNPYLAILKCKCCITLSFLKQIPCVLLMGDTHFTKKGHEGGIMLVGF